MKLKSIKNYLAAGLLLLAPLTADASYAERADVKTFVDGLVKRHGFDRKTVMAWIDDAQQQTSALDAIARPAESKPWKDYRPIFITQRRINQGVQFWRDNADILARAEKTYGVPAQIIVAIIGVETFYGKRAGNYRVLDALVTLGFDYPPRGKFFQKELEQFFMMCKEQGFDPRYLKGSYSGAMGMPQFIASSFRAYAVDFDGDKTPDLWENRADVIGSIANYFSKHGWQRDEPIATRATVPDSAKSLAGKKMKPEKTVGEYKKLGVTTLSDFDNNAKAVLLELDGENGPEYWLGLNNFYVITRYNHSPLYAMAAYQLSQAITTRYRMHR